MRTFLMTALAIEILYRTFGDPRTCVTIVFWRWILGGLDAGPRRQSRMWQAETQRMWQRRFDNLNDTLTDALADSLATPAAF